MTEEIECGQERLDAIMPQVYNELRRLARRHLRGERPWHTLDTTALVNEAYLKLRGQDAVAFENKGHFLAAAAQAMRRILVDYARKRRSKKRGGNLRRVELDETGLSIERSAEQVLAIDEALGWLGALEPRLAQVVELRFFGGLTFPEVAEAMNAGLRTVKRDWQKARALLLTHLSASLERDVE